MKYTPRQRLGRLIKTVQYNSPLRKHLLPRYLYQCSPQQLFFLCQCVKDTSSVEGGMAEIGCERGYTTVFLNKFMDAEGIEKPYNAIDTFSGFVDDDVAYEVKHRGKAAQSFSGTFIVNKQSWFDGTMKQNGISRVISSKEDVNEFDLTTIGPLSFCLLDVDLYRPVKKAIPELYEILSPGGIIVVDDCDPTHDLWDGADQAYKEFMKKIGQPVDIVHTKFGLIRKPA